MSVWKVKVKDRAYNIDEAWVICVEDKDQPKDFAEDFFKVVKNRAALEASKHTLARWFKVPQKIQGMSIKEFALNSYHRACNQREVTPKTAPTLYDIFVDLRLWGVIEQLRHGQQEVKEDA